VIGHCGDSPSVWIAALVRAAFHWRALYDEGRGQAIGGVEFVWSNPDGDQIAEQNSDSVKVCAQPQRRLQEARLNFKSLAPTS
jgi:hypothetical protein